jgi:hypothetical protein
MNVEQFNFKIKFLLILMFVNNLFPFLRISKMHEKILILIFYKVLKVTRAFLFKQKNNRRLKNKRF